MLKLKKYLNFMKLIRKENGEYHLLVNSEIKSLQEFNITKEDCDILTLGYNVEKMAEEWFLINQYNQEDMIHSNRVAEYITTKNLWKTGFNAHKELVKDKLFTVEQVNSLVNSVLEFISHHEPSEFNEWYKKKLQKYLPKTEWDCTISTEGKIILL